MTPERLSIALVRARYNPFGGAERFAERAMATLVGGAVDVTVVARSWSSATATERVRLLRCDPFYLGSLWRDWSFARAVRHALTHERFDLVQSHERIAGLDVYRAGDGVHAVWLERRAASGGWRTRLAIGLNPHHRYLVRAERVMFEHPGLRAVICNSTMVRDEILARFRIPRERLHVIHNGVDRSRFNPGLRSAHRERTRQALGIGTDAITFAFVGSGFERKGLAFALAALPPEAHLLVVGSDKERARYEARARALGTGARVHFVGEQADATPYYGAADALVLPTLYDPFPNAALEALACGLPVITSDACGARELIRQAHNGWVVPLNSGDALRQAMVACGRACADETTRDALRSAALASVEGLDNEAMGELLIDLYRQLLGRSSPRPA